MSVSRPSSPAGIFAPKTSQEIKFRTILGPKDILHPLCVYDAGDHFIAVFGILRTKTAFEYSEARFNASCVAPLEDGKEKRVRYLLSFMEDKHPWEISDEDGIGHCLFDYSSKFGVIECLRPYPRYPLVYVNEENTQKHILNMLQSERGRTHLAEFPQYNAYLPAESANANAMPRLVSF